MKYKIITLICVLAICFLPVRIVEGQSAGPVYVVQPGDTLNSIAERFGISLNDLLSSNNLSDPNLISAGMQLVIPSLPEISGMLNTEVVPFGETIRSLAKRYQVSEQLLNQLNRITSPSEVYAGSNLVLLQQDNQVKLDSAVSLPAGSNLLEMAVQRDLNPWRLAIDNGDSSLITHNPSEVVYVSSAGDKEVLSPISPKIQTVTISPLPISQGDTVEIKITANEPLDFSGYLGDSPLHFQKMQENEYTALQGIHAMSQIGLVPLTLNFTDSAGIENAFQQSLLLKAGGFGQDPPLMVDSETIDPTVTKPEEQEIREIISGFTPERYWQGLWQPPTANPDCVKSRYGNRRSYNGSDFTYFHQGVDYGVCVAPSLAIFAPAPGKVVFTGPLTVRGNTTIIDHGWGIYTAYFHQAEIKINPGDVVETGQDIGTIGATGRVTGPHLHWEIWVNGVQVQPLDWLNTVYP